MADRLDTPISTRTRRLLWWSAGLLALTIVGCLFTGSARALFLPWNLFLAWVPYVLGRGIVRLARRTPHGTGLLVLPTLLWLLFLPNAPYIVTDFVHVPRLPAALVLPGAGLVAGYALVALMLGLYSLADLHRIVSTRLGERLGWAFAATVLLLASVGVWMGRVLRWNSWDAASDPLGVLRTSLHSMAHSTTAHWFIPSMTLAMLIIYVVRVRRGEIDREHPLS